MEEKEINIILKNLIKKIKNNSSINVIEIQTPQLWGVALSWIILASMVESCWHYNIVMHETKIQNSNIESHSLLEKEKTQWNRKIRMY